VSREALLEDIWGGDPTEGVLDATIHRLRKKLEANLAEPRFVTTVRGIGYRLEMGALAATI
jgi:DNA-binding response OmpR family regulator